MYSNAVRLSPHLNDWIGRRTAGVELFFLTGVSHQAAILSASSSAFLLSTAPCPNQAESKR